MKILDKEYFLKNIKNIHKTSLIQKISSKNINEFKIGKNYFYEINNDELLKVQKWINNYFQENIPLNNAATAFRKKISYLHLFEPHKKSYYFLRLDIKSFFHTIEVNDVKDIFKEYFENSFIDKNKKQSLLQAFLNIITYKIPKKSANKIFRGKQVLPMGFKTSPVISNIIFRKLDIQIQKLCSTRNIIYTRYADDMLFSAGKNMSYIHSDNFINEINILLSQMNFKLNRNKTLKAKHTLSLNGYTIQYSKFNSNLESFFEGKEKIISEVRLSNKKLNIIKKMIHMVKTEKQTPKIILKKLFNYSIPTTVPVKKETIYNEHQLLNKLIGYRSYLLSIISFNNKYQCCQKNTVEKYLGILEDLNNIIEKYDKTSL